MAYNIYLQEIFDSPRTGVLEDGFKIDETHIRYVYRLGNRFALGGMVIDALW